MLNKIKAFFRKIVSRAICNSFDTFIDELTDFANEKLPTMPAETEVAEFTESTYKKLAKGYKNYEISFEDFIFKDISIKLRTRKGKFIKMRYSEKFYEEEVFSLLKSRKVWRKVEEFSFGGVFCVEYGGRTTSYVVLSKDNEQDDACPDFELVGLNDLSEKYVDKAMSMYDILMLIESVALNDCEVFDYVRLDDDRLIVSYSPKIDAKPVVQEKSDRLSEEFTKLLEESSLADDFNFGDSITFLALYSYYSTKTA